MISNVHYIELRIGGELVELESQSSLNLRINNVLFNPTQTTTTQAEYSFSFDIPSTPNNDKILNYASTLSRINKFHTRYPSQVYADGTLIFNGTLTVQSYNGNTKMYNCNLVTIKTNTLDEIFGDMKLTDLKWMVDFDGAASINSGNTNYESKYFFPLVSYGVFQKGYVTKDEVGATYTPKHRLDKYNKWWCESFYPSLNMCEIMKKAFQNKGYNVIGNIFTDNNLNRIYCSTNLADGQVPSYNLGNPLFGHISLSASLSTSGKTPYQQELKFPYFRVSGMTDTVNGVTTSKEYNYSDINIYDILADGSVTVNSPTYMYDPGEKVIVIPDSGFYKIDIDITSTLNTSGNLTANQYIYDSADRELREESLSLPVGINEITPMEIALIRNYDDNYELIKGKHNKRYINGNPNDSTYMDGQNQRPNISEWETCFPHEDPYNSYLPTETNELTIINSQKIYAGKGDINSSDMNYRGGSRSNRARNTESRDWSEGKYGYINGDSEIMAYDQAVSEGFICGFSSLFGGIASVMKNGYSWSKSVAAKNEAFYPEIGYSLMYTDTQTGNIVTEQTNFNYNTYINCPISTVAVNPAGTQMTGHISCMVWLERNDILELMAIHRGYHTTYGRNVEYATTTTVNLDISAASPRSYYALQKDNYNYYSNSEFPYQLNLFNFTNEETKVVDWINNIKTAFNLEIFQDNETVEINTNQGIKKNINYAIEIDDRVNNGEATSEYISYPKEMSVQYKIDTDEWGFELTVPEDHINDDDWAKWGDSGFTVIQLNDDTYETQTQNTQTQFSYTYYDNFDWKEVYQDGTEESGSTSISIPVLSKSEYMVEGYSYDESMKHDGYSLTQRFWYREQPTQMYVWMSSYMHEKVYLCFPSNQYDRFNLSYKDTEKSIATEYFNIYPMLSSNYVKVETYLTPDEYNSIKGGALVNFDSDLYYVSEISGYDPSGGNTTQLKLIKKT